MRIADANTKIMTAPGAKYEGAEIKRIALKQAFHGRTHRPATISDSCYGKYQKNLKTFETRDSLIIVPSNDVAALEAVFEDAEEKGYFIELIAVEPVQGEGAPGQIISREFLRRCSKTNPRTWWYDISRFNSSRSQRTRMPEYC